MAGIDADADTDAAGDVAASTASAPAIAGIADLGVGERTRGGSNDSVDASCAAERVPDAGVIVVRRAEVPVSIILMLRLRLCAVVLVLCGIAAGICALRVVETGLLGQGSLVDVTQPDPLHGNVEEQVNCHPGYIIVNGRRRLLCRICTYIGAL
jgi:hypothetical protein